LILKDISQTIAANETIQSVDLSGNYIGAEGVSYTAGACFYFNP
jgi:Ran GTPase-activating protein (RanGAP) involved in mRNA processing and transport